MRFKVKVSDVVVMGLRDMCLLTLEAGGVQDGRRASGGVARGRLSPGRTSSLQTRGEMSWFTADDGRAPLV